MKRLAILSAKKLITLSAVGVLSLATVGGAILNNNNEEPQTAQSSVKFEGELKESPTAEIVEVEKVESEKIEEVNEAPIVANEAVEPPKAPIVEYVTDDNISEYYIIALNHGKENPYIGPRHRVNLMSYIYKNLIGMTKGEASSVVKLKTDEFGSIVKQVFEKYGDDYTKLRRVLEFGDTI